MRRSFFWKVSRDISPCACSANWNEVFSLRVGGGGLGVISLKEMNLSLFGKWLWKFFNKTVVVKTIGMAYVLKRFLHLVCSESENVSFF